MGHWKNSNGWQYNQLQQPDDRSQRKLIFYVETGTNMWWD